MSNLSEPEFEIISIPGIIHRINQGLAEPVALFVDAFLFDGTCYKICDKQSLSAALTSHQVLPPGLVDMKYPIFTLLYHGLFDLIILKKGPPRSPQQVE